MWPMAIYRSHPRDLHNHGDNCRTRSSMPAGPIPSAGQRPQTTAIYRGLSYHTLIRVLEIEGVGGPLRLAYFDAAYAAGVQFKEKRLRSVVREPDYVVLTERCAEEIRTYVIQHLELGRFKSHFNGWLAGKQVRTVDELAGFLDRRFEF